MNTIVILAALASAALAGPLYLVSVSQDTLGNYKFDYKTEDASRSEQANAHNEVNGYYTFIDKEGHHHHIQYTSGVNGFKAVGDSIPLAPAVTPEVARATHEHNHHYQEVLRTLPVLRDNSYHHEVHQLAPPQVPHHQHAEPIVIVDGVPQDTREVAHAKEQLLLAHKEAIYRLIH